MTIETRLKYELTSLHMSLFSINDQKMTRESRQAFQKSVLRSWLIYLISPTKFEGVDWSTWSHRLSLKELIDRLDLTDKVCSNLVIDCCWLLYTVTWDQVQNWQDIDTQIPELCAVSWNSILKEYKVNVLLSAA